MYFNILIRNYTKIGQGREGRTVGPYGLVQRIESALKETGIDTKDIRIISNLDWRQKARLEDETSDPIKIER